MNRMDWLLLAFNVGVFLFLVRWLWCKRADRLAEAGAARPRCKHGADKLRGPKCAECRKEDEEYFAEKKHDFLNDDGMVEQMKASPLSFMETYAFDFDYAALETRLFNMYTGPEPVWRAQDGRVMAIRRMTNEHLLNTIKMLNRKYMAQSRFQPIHEKWPVYGELIKESRKRKLHVEVLS